MEGSILIYGANRFSRQQKVLEYANALLNGKLTGLTASNPDVLIIEKEADKNTIGIEKIRAVIKFLSEYPYQESHKIVIISKAETLTIPAQNALLKTLEEPPAYALIILEAKSENVLLETVVSRCQRIVVKAVANQEDDSQDSVKKLLAMDIGNRLVWAEETSKRERQDIVDLLEEWLGELRGDVEKNQSTIEATLKVSRDLNQTNVNVRLALEYLMLTMRR